jgi:hypothetical protein
LSLINSEGVITTLAVLSVVKKINNKKTEIEIKPRLISLKFFIMAMLKIFNVEVIK